MKIRTVAALGVAAVVGLLGTACTDDASPSAAPTQSGAPQTTADVDASDTPDPCLLLTAEDFTAASGVTFHQLPPAEPDDFMPPVPGERSCHFEETDDQDGLPSAAWIVLFPEDRAEFDAGRQALMDLFDDQGDIDGIGESAYGNSTEIRIYQDGWYIEIQMQFVDLEGTDAIEGLARTALSRLP